jgi:hypothetical protein
MPAEKRETQGGQKMNELLMLVIVVAVWFFAQWWLLPRLGIST